MSIVIGIDLGTTYSAVAAIGKAGTPELVKNREGDATTPSVVLFQEADGADEPLVGSMAKHSAASDPENVVQFIKRFMGDPHYKFESSGGTQYKPEEISAIILKKLKEDAELALGEAVTDAVITVPAYFDDARRTATKQAGTIAGLNVLRLINEPTAAALAFGIDGDKTGKVFVYDLGGGTFDVTVMDIDGGEFDVTGTDGDRNLGGFDFDNALMTFVAEDIRGQGGPDLLADQHATADLREKAEMAKRSLTTVEKTTIHVSGEGKPYRVQVTREDFERVTASLLQRTQDMTEILLENHHLTWADVNHILLVGGSTRMPMVRAMIERISGLKPELGVDPDLAVCFGAAVQGAATTAEQRGQGFLIGGGEVLSIKDVTSQALGVITVGDDLVTDINSIVIPRDSKVPAKHTFDFRTVTESQQTVRIQVTEGDDSDPRFVTIVGTQELPLTLYPKGSPFRLIYAYDIDQVVFIEVYDLTADTLVGTFEIDRNGSLSSDQLRLATDKIRRTAVG